MPQYFLQPSTKLLPAIMISLHMEEKQFIHKLFEEFKGKDTFFVHKFFEAQRPRKTLQDIWKLL